MTPTANATLPPPSSGLLHDTNKSHRLCIAMLLIVVALAYGNSLFNAFTMDDIVLYIVRNTQVTAPSLRSLFTPHQTTKVFRPVTFGVFAAAWKIGNGRPALFHFVNLLLHAAVTLLFFLLLQAAWRPPPEGPLVAFVSALLFAVHPIHTEAVASAVGCAELLAAGFLLAAWILHIKDHEIGALLCFVLALLSKESAIAFLPLVLIGDFAMGRWKSTTRYWRIAGLTLLYAGILWKAQGGHFGVVDVQRLNNPLGTIPPGWRILNALRVAWRYVGLLFYPAKLSCDYSFNQIPVYLDWRRTLPAAIATVAALGGWAWAIHRRHYPLVLAGGIYLAAFSTTANILVPIGTIMGERLAYLPSAGFCLLIALAWKWLHDRQRQLAFAALTVCVVGFGFRTVVRNSDWKNNLTLFSAAVRAVPRSAKMHQALGATYVETGQLDLASAQFQEALRIDPDYPYALESSGLVETWKRNYTAAGPLLEKAYNLSTREDPNYDDMAVNLAGLYLQTNDFDRALAVLNREISDSPRYPRAWANRAVLHYQAHQLELARADAEMALRLDPQNGQARNLIQALRAIPPPPKP